MLPLENPMTVYDEPREYSKPTWGEWSGRYYKQAEAFDKSYVNQQAADIFLKLYTGEAQVKAYWLIRLFADVAAGESDDLEPEEIRDALLAILRCDQRQVVVDEVRKIVNAWESARNLCVDEWCQENEWEQA